MTEEIHVTFAAEDGRIVEADVEITYDFHARGYEGDGWYDCKGFDFGDVSITEGDDTTLESFMPEDLVEQAENEAEREFLKGVGE